MIIEEEETKTEVNPDVIEDLMFGDEDLEEAEVLMFHREDEDADALDLAFVDDEYEI